MEREESVMYMTEFQKGEAKRFKDLVALVKNTPKAYAQFYIGHTMELDSILSIHRQEENPIFKLSRFRQVIDKVPTVLRGAIYDAEALYEALKSKPTQYSIEQGEYIFIEYDNGKKKKVGKKIPIETGQKLFDGWMNEAAKWYDMLWQTLDEKQAQQPVEEIESPVLRLERSLTDEEMRRLINYEVVTIRPYVEEEDPAYSLAVITTCKLFPKPKSVEHAQFHWLYGEDNEQFLVNMEAVYEAKGSPIIFSNVVSAIKC